METRIGFIGFGEVGRSFAKEFATNGAKVYYFDIVRRKDEAWIGFLPLKELIKTCDTILSTVVSHMAVRVAQEASEFLESGKVYADMNSTSPATKKEIGRVIESTGADFVEGAILSAVGEKGSRASILVSGNKAEQFSKNMRRLGLVNLRFLSKRVGDSSTIKMIRSIFSKGVECLLLEMLIAARSAGVENFIWDEIIETMNGESFRWAAENWIKTHPLAFERRYHEILQVIETLKEIHVEPVITQGTLHFFERSSTIKWDESFQEKPKDFLEVSRFMEEYLRERR